jgi:DnaJ-class molecular chaperone
MLGRDDCPRCDGEGSLERTCSTCGGSGEVREGNFGEQRDCPDCNSTGLGWSGPPGTVVEDCPRCHGTGEAR